MGRATRPRPKRLGKKLKKLRERMELSQAAMCERLDFATIHPSHISGYEKGKREPPYPVLLKYAKLAGISTDALIDDAIKWP